MPNVALRPSPDAPRGWPLPPAANLPTYLPQRFAAPAAKTYLPTFGRAYPDLHRSKKNLTQAHVEFKFFRKPPKNAVAPPAHGSRRPRALTPNSSYEACATLGSIRPAAGVGASCSSLPTSAAAAVSSPGQHVLISPFGNPPTLVAANAAVEPPSRPYSPVAVSEVDGTLTFLVKSMPQDAANPLRGSFSRWLTGLSTGDTVRIGGPYGAVALDVDACTLHLPSHHGAALPVRHLALVAGGSGVAVVAQLLNAGVPTGGWRRSRRRTPWDRPTAREGSPRADGRLSAAAAAAAARDRGPPLGPHPGHALLTDELDALRGSHPRLISKLHRTFTSLPTGASSPGNTSARRIDEDMLRRCLPPPAADGVILCCGPSGFEASVAVHLEQLGHAHYVLLSSGTVRSPLVLPQSSSESQHVAAGTGTAEDVESNSDWGRDHVRRQGDGGYEDASMMPRDNHQQESRRKRTTAALVDAAGDAEGRAIPSRRFAKALAGRCDAAFNRHLRGVLLSSLAPSTARYLPCDSGYSTSIECVYSCVS